MWGNVQHPNHTLVHPCGCRKISFHLTNLMAKSARLGSLIHSASCDNCLLGLPAENWKRSQACWVAMLYDNSLSLELPESRGKQENINPFQGRCRHGLVSEVQLGNKALEDKPYLKCIRLHTKKNWNQDSEAMWHPHLLVTVYKNQNRETT